MRSARCASKSGRWSGRLCSALILLAPCELTSLDMVALNSPDRALISDQPSTERVCAVVFVNALNVVSSPSSSDRTRVVFALLSNFVAR